MRTRDAGSGAAGASGKSRSDGLTRRLWLTLGPVAQSLQGDAHISSAPSFATPRCAAANPFADSHACDPRSDPYSDPLSAHNPSSLGRPDDFISSPRRSEDSITLVADPADHRPANAYHSPHPPHSTQWSTGRSSVTIESERRKGGWCKPLAPGLMVLSVALTIIGTSFWPRETSEWALM